MAATGSKQEPLTAPSLKAMATVKNRNNIDDMNLQRTLSQFEREKALNILLLDHERLDLRDFLKAVKKCASNELPESKHWLSGNMGKARKSKTPSATGSDDPRTKHGGKGGGGSEPRKEEVEKYRPGEEEFDQGVFKTGNQHDQKSKAKVHMDIYSKRNAYASLHWVKDYFEEEGYDLSKKSPQPGASPAPGFRSGATSGQASRRVSEAAISAVAAENVSSSAAGQESHSGKSRSRLTSDAFSKRSDSRYASARSDGSDRSRRDRRSDILGLDRGSPERKSGQPRFGVPAGREDRRLPFHRGHGGEGARKPFQGDFMKELLVRNAHRRYRRKKKRPMEDRLKEFYERVEELIEKEEELTNAELERKWLLITKGVKAALCESSDEDEDDNQMHTI